MPFRVTLEQRAQWIAAAVANLPKPDEEFLAKLRAIPEVIHARTQAELWTILIAEMERPQRFRILRMEDGIRTKIPGIKRSFLEAGTTFTLWKQNEEQT